MSIKDFIRQIKPPCARCPYKLGLVHTLVDPCPQCRENGYQMFERFQKRNFGDYLNGRNDEKLP